MTRRARLKRVLAGSWRAGVATIGLIGIASGIWFNAYATQQSRHVRQVDLLERLNSTVAGVERDIEATRILEKACRKYYTPLDLRERATLEGGIASLEFVAWSVTNGEIGSAGRRFVGGWLSTMDVIGRLGRTYFGANYMRSNFPDVMAHVKPQGPCAPQRP